MDGVLIPWVIATTILLFVAAFWIYTLEQRIRGFATQYQSLLRISEALAKAPDQAALLPLVTRLNGHDARLHSVETVQGELAATLAHSVQGLGVVRYSAFEGIGGDQSFSVALVDSSGRGTVITGLHGGDAVRVWAKPLHNWRSSYSLSADEQRALGEARSFVDQAPGS
ncbi:MAG: DUF4446 family protein [Anaerolineae bacterium]|jgi:hypothetical protein|nr:DUF4446 family protein [Anaerolineae bacterium]